MYGSIPISIYVYIICVCMLTTLSPFTYPSPYQEKWGNKMNVANSNTWWIYMRIYRYLLCCPVSLKYVKIKSQEQPDLDGLNLQKCFCCPCRGDQGCVHSPTSCPRGSCFGDGGEWLKEHLTALPAEPSVTPESSLTFRVNSVGYNQGNLVGCWHGLSSPPPHFTFSLHRLQMWLVFRPGDDTEGGGLFPYCVDKS
jgi:hypothetical protein